MKLILAIILFISSNSFSQEILRAHSNYVSAAAGSGYVCNAPADADAQTFLDSTGITNDTIVCAVKQLVTDLKAAGVWTKLQAIYPFVGGTELTHRWNLKDPRNLDAAFRLIFGGTGWIHSRTGAKPSGAEWAQTYYVPSTNGTANSMSLTYYSRTNVLEAKDEMGCYVVTPESRVMLITRYSDGNGYGLIGTVANGAIAAVSDSRGMFTVSRTSSTAQSLYRNGSSIASNTNLNSASYPAVQIYLAGVTESGLGSGSFLSTKECAFASIGTGLTGTEAGAFYTAVQAFQTTLGRQM